MGTPPKADGGADISAVLAVGERIAEVARRKALVVVKSTVPVGTCDAVQAVVDKRASVPLEVVSNPEFLKEGAAVQDFFRPDRIVLGARSEEARETLRALYAPLQLSGERVVVTDPRSSELTKYAANTMLAMRVSFMNELSRLCHATGADVHAVRMGVGSDTRIGKRFLYAGPGYGGSCFPKDVQALLHLGRAHGVPMRMAEATHLANEEQAHFLAAARRAVRGVAEGQDDRALGSRVQAGDGRHPRVAGDEARGGAARQGGERRVPRSGGGAELRGGDGAARRRTSASSTGTTTRSTARTRWCCSPSGAATCAPNFAEIRKRLRTADDGGPPVVVDARNVWRPADVVRAGLRYQGIGVPTPSLERASKAPQP